MKDITLRVAAKSVIVNDKGEVLLVREANTYGDASQVGRYEIPGGRVEIGESFEDGLRREALEETGLAVEPLYPVFVGEWRPVIKGVQHQIVAVFVACKAKNTEVKLSEEHDKYIWIAPVSRHDYDIVDPDGEVIDAYAARQSKN